MRELFKIAIELIQIYYKMFQLKLLIWYMHYWLFRVKHGLYRKKRR